VHRATKGFTVRRRAGRATVPAEPGTIAGKWLLAGLLDHRDERDRLAPELKGPRPGLLDDFSVVETACEIAVRRYFTADYDIRDVTKLAELVRTAWDSDLQLNLMEVEAVIRAALGEHDVDLSGISKGAKLRVELLAAAGVVRWLSLDEPTARKLVVDAEGLAVARGHHPRPVSS
jgi:hypothetical protein